MLRRAATAATLLALVAAAVLTSGCGGADSGTAASQQLEAARRAGEKAALERSRITRLERQVRDLRRLARQRAATVVATEPGEAVARPARADFSVVLRSFHVPSGNVACQIRGDGALCAVTPIDATFVLVGDEAARVEPGAALAGDTGELVPYGRTITAGSVTCTVPAATEAHGIECADASTGHGFEASRVPARQRAY